MSNERDAVSRDKIMGKLTSKERNKLPSSDFAEPSKRAYPVNDRSHARSALSRVSQFGSSEEKKKVRAKVSRKFPDMGKSGRTAKYVGKKKSTGKRATGKR